MSATTYLNWYNTDVRATREVKCQFHHSLIDRNALSYLCHVATAENQNTTLQLLRVPQTVSMFLFMTLHCHLSFSCLLAGSISHRPRHATAFCPWPSSPSLSCCNPSLLFLSLYLFASCFVAYLFASTLRGSMWWLNGWWFLEVSWLCVLSISTSALSCYSRNTIFRKLCFFLTNVMFQRRLTWYLSWHSVLSH